MPTIRQARVGEMIKRDLSEIIQKEMRDSRVALVTITGVEVARDFTVAKVFVSAMGTPGEKATAVKALQGASGFLRGRLGGMLDLRTIPLLVFRPDTGIEQGVRMFQLLRDEQKFLAENLQPEVAAEATEAATEEEEDTDDDDTAEDDLDTEDVDTDDEADIEDEDEPEKK